MVQILRIRRRRVFRSTVRTLRSLATITGQFQPDRTCLVQLDVTEGDGSTRTIDAKLDTGFNGELAMPNVDFERMDTSSTRPANMVVADGRSVRVETCSASVRLGSGWEEVTVLNSGDARRPLIGLELLLGHSIYIEAKPFGEVLIEPLE